MWRGRSADSLEYRRVPLEGSEEKRATIEIAALEVLRIS
jgi:hypothetical protein